MRIENLLRITNGRLLNSPSIDAFEGIATDSSKVCRGDLFIDIKDSNEDIQNAIKNGAYAIIAQHLPSKAIDEEVAYLHVASIEKSMLKLGRFLSAQKNIKFTIIDAVQKALLVSLGLSRKIKILSSGWINILKELQKASENDHFFILDETIANTLNPQSKPLIKTANLLNCSSKGLFLTSFAHNQKVYQDIKIPSFFLDPLGKILAYLDENSIEYKLESLCHIEHFFPLFITQKIKKKEFGTTDRVLIFEKDKTLFLQEKAYLSKKIPSFDLLFCMPTTKKNLHVEKNVFFYSECKDFEALCKYVFKYALVLGDKNDFEDFLNRDVVVQASLF
ncbi:MAG: hypothetical protein PHN38_03070 [Sulfurospirillaceae bacterium]|nr:hypothetical protein [Sulfurospirillaceae bacterium]MDD3462340.1 hypothetical protein [Sulfurospirillaceae bacterium]